MAIISKYDTGADFEELYIGIRGKENRLYSDEEVLLLPDIDRNHPHYTEWELRKESYRRLKRHLEKKAKALRILEPGCGNGWLSHRLAEMPLNKVTGLEINQTEWLQAKRVFNHISNLEFIHGDMNDPGLENEKFDIVLFASCIQYFSSLKDIIHRGLQILTQNGEIHILDSHFYKSEELLAAKERTAGYFIRLGFPEMTEHYFHHRWDELSSFRYRLLYKPDFVQKHFFHHQNPFPWICIKKQ